METEALLLEQFKQENGKTMVALTLLHHELINLDRHSDTLSPESVSA